MKASYTFREGDRLWPLIALLIDTHVDDLDEGRLAELQATIDQWRVTHSDGSRFEPGQPRVNPITF